MWVDSQLHALAGYLQEWTGAHCVGGSLKKISPLPEYDLQTVQSRREPLYRLIHAGPSAKCKELKYSFNHCQQRDLNM